MIAKQKISQVTIFIILGIVIVIIFMVLIFINKYAAKRASTKEIMDAKEITFDVQPIKNFVDKCLDLVSKDGLKKIGKQGGYLFEGQGGPFIDYPGEDEGRLFINYGNSKVAYNILIPVQIGETYFDTPWRYPWINFPYPNGDINKEPVFRVQGVFGKKTFPPLTKPSANSMQEQLETFVENNIDICLDFSVFEEQGFSFTKKESEKIINLDITENDVVFRIRYPIIIGRVNSAEKTEIKDFSVKQKVRLKKLHKFVHDLIEADTRDVKYNILVGFEGSFIVDVKNNVYGKDDLIIVTDNNPEFFLDGIPYQYFFARKNRNPALNYIKNTKINIAQGTNINIQLLIEKLELKTEDPDEDEISYFTIPGLNNPIWNSKNPIYPEYRKFDVYVKDDEGLNDYQKGIEFTIVEASS